MTLTRNRQVQPTRAQGLLDLVPYVRHRIYMYHYLGMASFDGHPLIFYLDGRKPPPHSEASISILDRDESPPTSNFMGLLRSCHALYAETTALFYLSNRFVVSYSHQGSLGPLRALSPTSLVSLANLKIGLNESSCHTSPESWQSGPSCCFYGHDNGPWRTVLVASTMPTDTAAPYSITPWI